LASFVDTPGRFKLVAVFFFIARIDHITDRPLNIESNLTLNFKCGSGLNMDLLPYERGGFCGAGVPPGAFRNDANAKTAGETPAPQKHAAYSQNCGYITFRNLSLR
jgi:hypothetical protein